MPGPDSPAASLNRSLPRAGKRLRRIGWSTPFVDLLLVSDHGPSEFLLPAICGTHVARVFRPGAFSRQAPPLKRQATVPLVAPEACADTAVISSPLWRVKHLSERFLGPTENAGPRTDHEMHTLQSNHPLAKRTRTGAFDV